MRIAYGLDWYQGADSGVFRKVVAQTSAWTARGATVAVFLLSRRDTRQAWRNALDAEVGFQPRVWSGTVQRLTASYAWVRDILAWNPDVVYRRHDLYYPALELLFRSGRALALEINTSELEEMRHGAASGHIYRRLTRNRMLRRADGFISVSREILRHSDFARFGRRGVTIGNGIDLSAYPEQPAPSNEHPRLVMLGGAEHAWNGIDKAIGLARRFPSWSLDLVGIAPGELPPGAPPNVHAHGRLVRGDYERLMRGADAALGTLALHRKGMNETSALKFAEYMAFGLPAVIGYTETHFPGEQPGFVLRLPNTGDNVERGADAIRSFVETWRGRRIPRAAVSHLDLGATETQRLSFLAELRTASAALK